MSSRSQECASKRARWARLRFAVVGELLMAPPAHGELRSRIEALAGRTWTHPNGGEPVRFGARTIERWYYRAKRSDAPLEALAGKVHAGGGRRPSMSEAVLRALGAQYRMHPRWTVQLHHQNLVARAARDGLGPVPSYPTVRRVMKERGWVRLTKKRRPTEGEGLVPRERRSFEVGYVHALWHLDFHQGRGRVLDEEGRWQTPVLFGCLDDRSRLVPHAQWYLTESAETLVHGLSQALLKRGLPRALLTDNGAAMLAAEVQEGLVRLGITHHTTLAYTPEQNGKQETFWALVEGQLMAMLEGHTELTLPRLNEATQAWVELGYHRRVHRELDASPLQVALREPHLARPSPSASELRRAFRRQERRAQRRSDGTLSLLGLRFEVPSAYRTLRELTVRFARWDRVQAELIDPRTEQHLATLRPLDKRAHAEGRRRPLDPVARVRPLPEPTPVEPIAPELQRLMAEYAATGLPPAYLPQTPDPNTENNR